MIDIIIDIICINIIFVFLIPQVVSYGKQIDDLNEQIKNLNEQIKKENIKDDIKIIKKD
jgi:hypothetical protein